jgi:hypothetical protein
MKAFLCLTVGQEINGRNVVVRVDKASNKKEDIENFIKGGQGTWLEKLDVPGGKVDFFCERHLHEIEVENG